MAMKWDWWKRGEYANEIGDNQAPPDFAVGPADLSGIDNAVSSMQSAPLGEPPSAFDVRSVYDSRPVNAFDFNLSATVTNNPSATSWQTSFVVPAGYRAVPKKWSVNFDNPPPGPNGLSVAWIQQGNSDLQYNGPIIIGTGTDDPIETFFLCEEQTSFGIRGVQGNYTSGVLTVNINVWGQFIAVSEVALPFAASNRKYGT